MLNYGTTRTLLKNADRINSEHLVVAEWNMNKYYEISEYGVYENPVTASLTLTYTAGASDILDGQNYLIYDDGTTKLSPDQDYFSSITSIFQPNRPDPGIVLMQYYGDALLVSDSRNIKQENITPNSPRYYPFSYSRTYDYFNSAKIMKTSNSTVDGHTQANGKIQAANPFVVYNETFPCNKITIKVQNHATAPEVFMVQYLQGSTWHNAINVESNGADTYFSDGVCNLYYNGTTWTTSTNRVNDLTQLTSGSPTQLKNIKGLRLIVFQMKVKQQPRGGIGPTIYYTPANPGGLEIIELSPRLEMDITQYVESFSFTSSLGDTSNIGLPVGSVVSSTGQIDLSNEENAFLFSSTLNDLNMLNPDVKFTVYQTINSTNVPLKVMYSNEWNVGQDYTANISLEDSMKFLRIKQAPDLFLRGYNAVNRLSYLILTVLDNSGISGYEFKKSVGGSNNAEDIAIRNFFCRKEQTVAEVLEQLAVSAQCSMFYNSEDKLVVLTKERLSEAVDMAASTSETSGGTDFWMIFNEDYTTNGVTPAAEASEISGYTSNVMTYSEVKINPVTDGDISYKSYGPRKVPGVTDLPQDTLNQLTSDFPAAALAFSNYTYATKILWTPGQDNSAVMGAANLTVDLNDIGLKQAFSGLEFTALNEEEAIRQIYQTTNITASFGGDAAAALAAKESLVMFVDRNEGYTIADYEGTVLIDQEYIKFRGKLYGITATGYGGTRIIFSQEEFEELIRFLPKGSSLYLLGLVVEPKLNITSKSGAQYTYEIIGDGRARFNSKKEKHYAFAEDSDGIDPNKRFKLTLGESKNFSVPGNLTATTKFNFMETSKYKSAKNSLGTLNFLSLESYLGFLKINGPKSPAEDIALVQKIDEGDLSVADALASMNRQVDKDVPGDSFDPFVYMTGEKNIYGQYIDIDFVPNSISTRMRLFSSAKKRKNGDYIMSTNSSIAGIGFGLNANNEGYYLEVESVGSGKDSVAKKAFTQNLRFYKIFLNSDNKYEPELIMTAPVGAYTVSNTEVQVLKNSNTADPVFELEIRIKKTDDSMKYEIFYGDKSVGVHTETRNDAIGVNGTRIFMFVRNDSQAVYEYICAAARPASGTNKLYFKSANKLDQKIQSGIIPVNKDYLFKDGNIKYYFNDFARLVRQVKEYETRFEAPAFSSTLIDVSKVNPQYMIKKYEPTSFGAKIIAVNTSAGPIALGDDSSLPLYIVGIGIEELSAGMINMKDYFDNVDEKKRRATERERNLSIYGEQSFSFDSQYIQSVSQAKNLMKWIIKYCGRQRLKMSMEIYPNPLLELGDKVRIYDKTRGYTQDNANFGSRVFTISSITHAITGSGPTMTVEIVEVGE